jgi:hypothetical protein
MYPTVSDALYEKVPEKEYATQHRGSKYIGSNAWHVLIALDISTKMYTGIARWVVV